MEFTEEALEVLRAAMSYAASNDFEYVTPELILLAMCDNDEFTGAFCGCGGDLETFIIDLGTYANDYIERVKDVEPKMSFAMAKAFEMAGKSALYSGREEIGLTHLIHAIWQLPDSYAVYYMQKQNLREEELLRAMVEIEEEEEKTEVLYLGDEDEEEISPNDIMSFAPCLNDTLKDENPLIGREEELERTIQILCRKDKNNPIHIGEPGVGKTALTYGLVRRIKEGKVPPHLRDAKVFALDLGGMLAGTRYRGDFENRLKKVLAQIEKEEKPIIYIDEIHNLAGAGAVGENSLDASNMLKPYLAGGHIRFIGATTFEEYKKYFEKNKSLVRRFQNVEIREPSEEETVKILEGLKPKYEQFHEVTYAEGILEYVVSMSVKYIHERFLPDKAIDLIDEAGSYRKLHRIPGSVQTVDKEVINEVLTKICRVPVESVATDDVTGLSTLEERIKAQIFGQKEAVTQVVNAIKFSKAGLLEDNKPLASLLFVGPTGVGKTEIARTLAKELGVKLLRFDMSEYGEKHAVAKLIGAPAGYVGYEEGGLLTETIRKNPSAVLLLDEIEKAHADIYNILLQVMDYATLTDNQGRKADFRNVVLIMTSNAGANRIGKKGIGFQSVSQDNSVIMEEVKHTFQPEFRNRLNRIVVFNSMDDEMAVLVVEKKLGELKEMLAKKQIILMADEEAKKLIKKRGVSQEFGAREIDRVIRNEIKPLFVDSILFGSLKEGGRISLSAADGDFCLKEEE